MTNRHSGLTAASCPLCKPQLAAIMTGQTIGKTTKDVARRHRHAMTRRLVDDELRGMGLKKVKGGLGGTYWE